MRKAETTTDTERIHHKEYREAQSSLRTTKKMYLLFFVNFVFLSVLCGNAVVVSASRVLLSEMLHRTSAQQRPRQRHLVGIFQIAAHGQAPRQAGDFERFALQLPLDITGSGFPFQIGVGG